MGVHPLAEPPPADQPARGCLDCGNTLLPGQKFCAQCGQRASVGRLTLHDIGHEFVHALVHTDRSVYALLRSLVLRPGIVAREYVLGKRRRYFGPFATLVILIGISTLLSELLGFESITSAESLNGLQSFLNRHVNLIVFAQVPLFGLLCMGLFRADHFSFAEHAVMVAYAFCLRVLLFLFIGLPFWYFFHNPALLGWVLLVTWSVYFGFAATQFYSGNRLATWLKGAVAAALLLQLSAVLINGLAAGYDRLWR